MANSHQPSLTRIGINVFVGALGATFSEFKRLPPDDRDFQWILARLDQELQSPDLQCGPEDIATLQTLRQRLNTSIRWWDQHPYLDRQ